MNDLAKSPETYSELSLPPSFLWRLAEASVRGEDYFREVLEALPAAIYTTDPAGRITYYNKAAATLWGCRPELGKSEWCGSWKLFRTDGSVLPHDQCPMALALREKRPIRNVAAIAERPDGTRVPFLPFPTPIFDASGMLVGAVNMLVDITDQRRAEEYGQLLVSIVESSDDAIVSKTLDGIIKSWNSGAQRLFGYTAEEVIGKSITILIPPERADEEAGILQQLQNGQRVDHFETVRRRKDGTLLDISLTISPVRNAEGVIIGASKIARDISENKRAREQQKLLLGEMKHRVKNSLATVQAIALQTMHSASPEERAAFSARLHALGNAHDALTKGWDRANLRDIVEGALAPFQEEHRERFLVEGPDTVLVDATQSLLLAMALHELATNATKYGALSNRSGRVRLAWELSGESPVPRLKLSWMERGGPPVTPPEHKGFGSRLIERALGGERGDAKFRFDPQGITCTLELLL
jgi:two-component system, chemotaxis family, CheB/CheR fusion protein